MGLADVDIVLEREPAHEVVCKSYVGPYTGKNMLRPEFNRVSKWLAREHIKSGKWFRIQVDKYELGKPSSQRRWWACIEHKQKLPTKPLSDLELQVLPSTLAASVTFDPARFSGRLVYHGLEGWLDWRTKFGEYEEAGPVREIYPANPWTNTMAKKHITVQVPIRKLKR